jgi:hypothetical protein
MLARVKSGRRVTRDTKPGSARSAANGPDGRKVTIGWSEYVEFVDWGIDRLNAKVDTGAGTSALHVENMEYLPDDYAAFDVILSRDKSHHRKHVLAKISRWAKVRSSNGQYTLRCFVRTRIRIGPVDKEIELSLVSREKMAFRMLLGREALEKDFVIDVSRRRVQSAKKKPTRIKR